MARRTAADSTTPTPQALADASPEIARLLQDATLALKHKERTRCIELLDRARDGAIAAGDRTGLALACWFLAGAHREFGHPKGLADALQVALEHEAPIVQEERYASMHDWTFWVWDNFGYASPMPVLLFEAWTARRIAEGRNDDAVDCLALVAWQHAVTGNREGIRDVLDRWRAPGFLPEAFPYDSSDAILFDSAFSAGIWAEDEAFGREGCDAFLEFLRRTGTDPRNDHQFLRCMARAATLFGWKEEQDRFLQPYVAGLYGMNIGYDKAEMERIRGRGIQALAAGRTEEALEAFEAMAAHADQKKIGPEYVCEASLDAGRCALALGQHERTIANLKRAVILIDKYRVTAFEKPLERVYGLASR